MGNAMSTKKKSALSPYKEISPYRPFMRQRTVISTNSSQQADPSDSSNNSKRKKKSGKDNNSIPSRSNNTQSQNLDINTATYPRDSVVAFQQSGNNYNNIDQAEENGHPEDNANYQEDWNSIKYQIRLRSELTRLYVNNIAPVVANSLKKGSRAAIVGIKTVPWTHDMVSMHPDCHFECLEFLDDSINKLDASIDANFHLLALPAVKFPLEDNSLDYIHLRGVSLLKSIEIWSHVSREVQRTLKPGGRVCIESVLYHPSKDSIMVTSLIDTLKSILTKLDHDYDISIKYDIHFPKNEFDIVKEEQLNIDFESNPDRCKLFMNIYFHILLAMERTIIPELGIDSEDFRHRAEVICEDALQKGRYLSWNWCVAEKKAMS